MRFLKIAVCLLVVSPRPALGCIEHEAGRTGWFHEMRWSSAGLAGDGAEEPGLSGLWLLGVGLASVGLVVVSFLAYSRTAGGMSSAGAGEDRHIDRESPGLPIRSSGLGYA
jgi:hypothetical protein